MEDPRRRALRLEIPEDLLEWADGYSAPEAGRLNLPNLRSDDNAAYPDWVKSHPREAFIGGDKRAGNEYFTLVQRDDPSVPPPPPDRLSFGAGAG